MDYLLSFGYEQLSLELKERSEPRKTVIGIARIIQKISEYIIYHNSNTLKSFIRKSINTVVLKIALTSCDRRGFLVN